MCFNFAELENDDDWVEKVDAQTQACINLWCAVVYNALCNQGLTHDYTIPLELYVQCEYFKVICELARVPYDYIKRKIMMGEYVRTKRKGVATFEFTSISHSSYTHNNKLRRRRKARRDREKRDNREFI